MSPEDEVEPPTEPLGPKLETNPAYVPPAPPAPPKQAAPQKPAAPVPGPFMQARYRFSTGLPAGEVATIRGDDDRPVLSYRSFASVTGIIAALVSVAVFLAGAAAVAFLVFDDEPLRAAAALALTVLFTCCIALLVPRVTVTLYDDGRPALTLSQRASFPSATYAVAAPNGASLAELRKSPLSRFGRNRWTILQDGRLIGEAYEATFGGALMRKIAGKFHRRFEENVLIESAGLPVGRIIRRPDPDGRFDLLEISSDALDRRIAVAVATLILGREP